MASPIPSQELQELAQNLVDAESPNPPGDVRLPLEVAAKYFDKHELPYARVSIDRENKKENLVARVIGAHRSEEHTSELQSRGHLVCRLLLGRPPNPEPRSLPTRRASDLRSSKSWPRTWSTPNRPTHPVTCACPWRSQPNTLINMRFLMREFPSTGKTKK